MKGRDVRDTSEGNGGALIQRRPGLPCALGKCLWGAMPGTEGGGNSWIGTAASWLLGPRERWEWLAVGRRVAGKPLLVFRQGKELETRAWPRAHSDTENTGRLCP